MNKVENARYSNDKLYEGLPCIWDGEKYLVFSPSSRKIIRLSKEEVDDPNIKAILEREGLLEWSDASLSENKSFSKLLLIVTSNCNLRCKYCYVFSDKRQHTDMSTKLALDAVNASIKSTTKKLDIGFFGGEPTLNIAVIKDVVNYTRQLSMPCSYQISTNGVIADDVIDYLLKNDFRFSLSSDGTPELNDVQRIRLDGKSTAEAIEKTIKSLVSNKAHFKIRSTITRLNVGSMAESIKYWAHLGVKFVHFELIKTNNESPLKELSLPESDVFIDNFNQAVEEAEKQGVWLINATFMNLMTPSKRFCTSVSGGRYMFAPDGTVSLCYEVQDSKHQLRDFIVGKYNAEESLFEFDEAKLSNTCSFDVDKLEDCKYCHVKYICGGGCPAIKYQYARSNENVKKYYCGVKKALIHEGILRIYQDAKENKTSPIFGTAKFERYGLTQ